MARKVGLVALAVVLTLVWQPPAPAAERLTLMLDWFPNPNHVPIYAALRQGYFAQEGLEVAIQVPVDPADPLKLAAARRVDVSINYQHTVTIARAQGLPVVSVGLLVDRLLGALIFLKDSGITTTADLRGKRIGFGVPGWGEAVIKAIAAHGGVREGEFQTQYVGFNLVPALLGGKVDAVTGLRNYEPIVLEIEGRAVGMLPYEAHGIPDYYQLLFIAHPDTVKQRRGAIKGFVRGVARGIAYTIRSPRQAYQQFAETNPRGDTGLNRRAFAATLPYFARSQEQRVDRWARLQDFMYGRKLIGVRTPPAARFVNLLEGEVRP
ncbi:MAG: ABC transporter substrate-binding protein [Armatimonadetes bacterium]|nr:ABC transporter substrate-binding protein [Armatimonadota bacterium]